MLVEQAARLSDESGVSLTTATDNIPNDALDLETLKAFDKVKSEHGSDFVIELIDLYLEGTPQRIKAIREASVEKEWVLLQRSAHTIKGSSSTLGLHQVAQVCEKLEVTNLSSTDAIDGLVRALESRFAEAREALMAERNRRLQ